jgi:hypothetical protein
MIRSVIIVTALALSITASAQTTITKVNGKCPSGYHDGKGAYCYGSKTRTADAITKTNGKCPSGYSDSKGAYCYSAKSSPDVINKVGGKCPTGYRDGQGAYCYAN